jgi:hypothetical protein
MTAERQDAKATGTLTQREIASVMTPQFRI